jgi:hypothetical protein
MNFLLNSHSNLKCHSKMLKTVSTNVEANYFGTAHGVFSSTATQSITNTTESKPVTFNGAASSNHNISMTDDPADGHSRLTFAEPGFYMVCFEGQAANANANVQDMNIWIRYKGTDAQGFDSKYTVNPKHGTVPGALCIRSIFIIKVVAANDYLQFIIAGTSTDLSLAPLATGTNPTSPSGFSASLNAHIVAPL